MTEARRLTAAQVEERRRNLKAFRTELEMEGDQTFTATLQMQEEWLATVDALVAREGELVAALERERDHWRAALTAFKGNDTVDIDYASALRAESELTRTLTGR